MPDYWNVVKSTRPYLWWLIGMYGVNGVALAGE